MFAHSVRVIKTSFYLIGLFIIMAGMPAHAQELNIPVDILPAMSLDDIALHIDEDIETHPPVRMTPDRSEIIHLDTESKTVIVGNPKHLSVLVETAKTLILVPKLPGATHFTVLDGRGELIMQRHVIVGSPKERYVRIRKSCANSESDSCAPTSMYYCPNMCHEISVDGAQTAEGSSSALKDQEDTLDNLTGAEDEPGSDGSE